MDSETKYDAAVLGAGISGLAVGLDLCRKGKKIIIFEKEKEVGGLCRSFTHNGLIMDYGPHLLFRGNKRTIGFVDSLNFSDCVHSKKLHHSLWYNGKFYDFTKNIDRMKLLYHFKRIPIFFIRIFLSGRGPKEKNAEEWVVSSLGKKSYEMFFKPMLYKRFKKDLKEVSAIELNKIVKRYIKYGIEGDEAYVDGGMGMFPLRIAEEIKKLGGEIVSEVSVKKIEKKNDIFEVCLKKEKIKTKTIISTIPPNSFSSIFNIKLPKIDYLHSVFIYFGVKERALFGNFDIIIPDQTFWFQRVFEPAILYNSSQKKSAICADRYFTKIPKNLEKEKEKCIEGLNSIIPNFSEKIEWCKVISYPHSFAVSKEIDPKTLPNGLFLFGQYCVEEKTFPSIDELITRSIKVANDVNSYLETQ